MKKNTPINLRRMAAQVIDLVMTGHNLPDSLAVHLPAEARDRALVQALCYGVCRFYLRLDGMLQYLLKTPLKPNDKDVYHLLLVGLYQLMEMRIPPHAVLFETVAAVKETGKEWMSGLVNAILRRYLREREVIDEQIKADPAVYYAHPRWWVATIRAAWPMDWQAILEVTNQHPPFALRVNQQKMTRDEYIKWFEHQKEQCLIRIISETQTGLILDTPIATDALPGFAEGYVSVQDGASQLAVQLMNLSPNLHILDACAAPGGKLCALLENEPSSSVVAVEKENARMELIKENLKRLQLNATCLCQDVNNIKAWWDGRLFDRILLDAPCSASGVARRHPDIKWLRQSKDIVQLANKQKELLLSLWPLLQPGGYLLYATCSLFPEENEQVIQAFLAMHEDATEDVIAADWGRACTRGRQILPNPQMDGFYYARLRKKIIKG